MNGSKCSFNGNFPFTMVFVKEKNDCGMATKWILDNKKGRRKKNAARNKTERKYSEDIKGMKLKICRRAKNYGAIRQAV